MLLPGWRMKSLELVGIYHSHPHGPPGLSEIDVKEAYYPEVVHLVWSRTHRDLELRRLFNPRWADNKCSFETHQQRLNRR